jgi:hypothetical protein
VEAGKARPVAAWVFLWAGTRWLVPLDLASAAQVETGETSGVALREAQDDSILRFSFLLERANESGCFGEIEFFTHRRGKVLKYVRSGEPK